MEQAARIGQISIVQNKFSVSQVRILIKMVNAVSIEERAAPLDAVNIIAFLEQKLRQIRSVLPCYACYQSTFRHVYPYTPGVLTSANLWIIRHGWLAKSCHFERVVH